MVISTSLLHGHRCLSAGAGAEEVASSRELRAIAVEFGERSVVRRERLSWNRCRIGLERRAVARQRMWFAVAGLVVHSCYGERVAGLVVHSCPGECVAVAVGRHKSLIERGWKIVEVEDGILAVGWLGQERHRWSRLVR